MAESAGLDVFFVLVGAILVFAMHGGFAFLELGTVRGKNQVNALVKILVDFAFSTLAYFVIGYTIAYGVTFFHNAATLSGGGAGFAPQGFSLVKFFFLATFAAAVPAIISGGIAERAKFWPQVIAAAVIVGLIYPFSEGIVWNANYGIQAWLEATFGARFHDFAGSIQVHALGGWLALAAVLRMGARVGRYGPSGRPFAPSSIPWLALGTWLLCIGWFGFNVMSAQSVAGVSGLVAINSLLAMVGGIIAAVVVGKNDPGFTHNGALAGLVAVCAGSDLYHPLAALAVGAVAGVIFVKGFILTQEKLKIDDVLGVWPLHGLCGLWGGIAAGIFGLEALGGMGGVSFVTQLVGSLAVSAYAFAAGYVLYWLSNRFAPVRLSDEQQRRGADLAIHSIGAEPEF
ncbi:MAG TPA: ammonium transporter [Devosia sp.]|jgi:Amt family ammonium transporter|uniref:ammonium transporter n=1 Tax=Devosia sp. TaxID=1871048 RepID=UPI002DDCC6D5|nr:ammonium transporter [Devosia sp.]HEV2515323.1 ammonium transporter [Devosia sp.]